MKKRYNSPVVEFVELKVMPVMSTASLFTVPGRGNAINQKSDEVRSDWENIWGDM